MDPCRYRTDSKVRKVGMHAGGRTYICMYVRVIIDRLPRCRYLFRSLTLSWPKPPRPSWLIIRPKLPASGENVCPPPSHRRLPLPEPPTKEEVSFPSLPTDGNKRTKDKEAERKEKKQHIASVSTPCRLKGKKARFRKIPVRLSKANALFGGIRD